jgi:hypothetical protein
MFGFQPAAVSANIGIRKRSFHMRIAILTTSMLAVLGLSGCMSHYDDIDGRYDTNSAARQSNASTVAHTGELPEPRSFTTGWTSNSKIKEAERKSIASDMPYAVVKPL